MPLPSIEQVDFTGKKVLLRVDFNVPLDKASGAISDDTRMVKSLPTIELLLNRGAAVVIISHLGRPEKRDNKSPGDPSLSLKKVAAHLAELLPGRTVNFSAEAVGPVAEEAAGKLKAGDILVLENIRYYDEETAKEEKVRSEFAKKLCKLADIYVDDAFGAAHRAHASIYECAKILPGYAGLLLKKEIDMLEKLVTNPPRPFVAIIGGSKVSSKLAVLENLISKADSILIGGAMAYTFLKSRLIEVGNSMIEKDYLSQAFQIVDKAAYNKKELLLPEDHVVSSEFGEKGKIKTVKRAIPDGFMGMDIGPKTADHYAKVIKKAQTVLWNGPMGVFEMKKFSSGTIAIAKAMAKTKGTTIVGGGDSIFALAQAGLEDKMTHVSTGGGATLEYLEGKKLPGVEALMK
ncbi:MAG: phosphoglycerate kinase [Leptospiraceae bacterium]|nr:phosphoglycerate kinase [Leptospiraceae bacterium]